jgi:uncharacterized protein YhjY with autotransporter beta-barrel domain
MITTTQSWQLMREQSSSKGGRRVACSSANNQSSWSAGLSKQAADAVFALVALMALVQPQTVLAQPFDQAWFGALEDLCEFVNVGGGQVELGPTLNFLCNQNAATSVLSAAPATISPDAASGGGIERRLQSVRESEEERREASAARIVPAAYLDEHILASSGRLQLPPAGGGGPEIVVGPAQGLSLFFNAGATALNHHNNEFEDGYQAQLPTATIGADYWFTPKLLAGIAFNYTNFDGSYDDGGGFDKDIYSPVLYATFLPFDGAFVSAVFAYARNENSNTRKVAVETADGPLFEPPAPTSADYSENQYSTQLQAGYDHPIENFTIGPRLGFALGHSQIDSFKEKGDTGLELRYSGLNQTSVQTSLGAAATVTIPIPNGVLLPQASVAWVHEYDNNARNIDARFVDASPSPKFTFQRERPARNWANIGLGISASLLNGMQPFAQFQTVQGNENFVSYGGTAGLRFSF